MLLFIEYQRLYFVFVYNQSKSRLHAYVNIAELIEHLNIAMLNLEVNLA